MKAIILPFLFLLLKIKVHSSVRMSIENQIKLKYDFKFRFSLNRKIYIHMYSMIHSTYSCNLHSLSSLLFLCLIFIVLQPPSAHFSVLVLYFHLMNFGL